MFEKKTEYSAARGGKSGNKNFTILSLKCNKKPLEWAYILCYNTKR